MTAVDRPDNGQDEGDARELAAEIIGNVLLASRQSGIEDLGISPRRWGREAARQLAEAGLLASGRAGAGEQQRDEPLHEVECPSCGATIRARMADGPQPDGEADRG